MNGKSSSSAGASLSCCVRFRSATCSCSRKLPGNWSCGRSSIATSGRGINFEGTNKPYERQITDQKRNLLVDTRKGIAGRVEIQEGEMESLIATRHKMGYMLNFDRENVLILSKGDLPVIALLLFLDLDRFFFDWTDWILDVTVVLCLG